MNSIFIKGIFIFILLCSTFDVISSNSTDYAGAERILHIAGEYDYPPYEFINSNGEPDGFSIELTKEVMKRMGRKYEIELNPWAQSFDKFKSGKADMVCTLAFSKERSDQFFFSQMHSKALHKFISKKDIVINNYDDLKDVSILILEDDVVDSSAISLNIGNHILYVPSISIGFKMLQEEENMALLCSKEVAEYFINKSGYDGFHINAMGFLPREYCFACNDEELRNEVNMALYQIKEDGTYDMLYSKWFGNPVITKLESQINNIIIFFLIILLIFTFYLLIQRNAIKKKNKILNAYRNKMQIIVDHSNLTIWEYDRKTSSFKIEGKDDLCKKVISFKEEDFKYIHPDDREKAKFFRNKIKQGEYVNNDISMRIVLPGSDDFYSVSLGCISTMQNEKGEYINYVGYGINTSSIHSMELRLQSSLELLNAIIESFPLPFFIKDVNDDFRYISSNEAMTLHCGLKREDIIGKTDKEVYPEQIFDNIRKNDLLTVRMTSNSYREEVFNPSKNVYQKLKFVINTLDGKQLLLGIIHNITESEEAKYELELQKHRADLAEEADRMKSEFIANMSHEIRTPLNAIVGFSQLIGIAENDEERDEYLKIISNSSNLLVRVIDDILTLSKLEAGLINIYPKKFDFKETFNDLYISFRMIAENKKIKLTQKAVLEECHLVSDRDRVSQILGNLISNAIKYTESEGEVCMSYEINNGEIKVSVSDTGIGIPTDKKHRIFNRFEKLDKFAQGTGLGLSISKMLTKKLNGEIGFDSEEGKGSTFWVKLPNLSIQS